MSVDWDVEVELIEPAVFPSLNVVRQKMPLRAAIEAMLAMPRERQNRSGISLHRPIMVEVDGRRALQGYLNGAAVRYLVGQHDFPAHV